MKNSQEYWIYFLNRNQNYRVNSNIVVPENIHTPPTEGIGISWGEGGSMRPKNLKKCIKLNWNFQRGGSVSEKIPFMAKVWIFSGTTQCQLVSSSNHCALTIINTTYFVQ